jgi:hypothetical protein
MTAPKKNTRRAAMDAERFDWRCFRFSDDKRQWKALAQQRRAFFVTAANHADQDGTNVLISVETFKKAAGERRTAFNRISDLAAMGIMLPELYVDEFGQERERLTQFHGTKRRRLIFDRLESAQGVIDAGREFEGHQKLSEEEQRQVQRSFMAVEEVQKSSEKKCRTQSKEVQNSKEEVQNSEEEVQNSKEEVQNSKEEVQPCVAHNRKSFTEESVTEGSKTEKEFLPTNLPTETSGMVGGRVGGKNLSEAKATQAGKEELTLTEDVMRERLQEVHRRMQASLNARHMQMGNTKYDDIPISPNLAGCKELFNELRKRSITRVDQMGLVCEAYGLWFGMKYIPSFDLQRDAENRREYSVDEEIRTGTISRSVYVPEPVLYPFKMFRKELKVYLDIAREDRDEAATETKP